MFVFFYAGEQLFLLDKGRLSNGGCGSNFFDCEYSVVLKENLNLSIIFLAATLFSSSARNTEKLSGCIFRLLCSS